MHTDPTDEHISADIPASDEVPTGESTASHSTAGHSTTGHSTAGHSTADNSTASVPRHEKRHLSPAQKDFLRGRLAVSPAATTLVAGIYLLLLLSRLIDAAFLSRESQYLSIILLQLLIFPIPAYLYIRLRPAGYVKSLRLRMFRLSHLFLVISAILMLIS